MMTSKTSTAGRGARKPSVRAVKAIAKSRIDYSKPIPFSSGYWANVTPVSASLISDAQRLAVTAPTPPMVWVEDKQRDEPNPNDPRYLAAIEQHETDRTMAAIDAMILFGVEMVDEHGEPLDVMQDTKWLSKLKLLAKMGILNLEGFDFDDSIEVEFLFKKYVAIAPPDLAIVTGASGLSEADIAEAVETFRNHKT